MIQEVLIGLVFLGAIFYLALMIRKQFVAKEGCPKGCGCSSLDIEKIEKEFSKTVTQKNN